MGKFSSFLIYSRKNIKHSENIFHILRAIQNILHGSSSWVLQQIHWFSDAFTCSYKNKTYKRDIYTSLTCKSWGTPLPSVWAPTTLWNCHEACNHGGGSCYILYFVHTVWFVSHRWCHTKEQFQFFRRHKRMLGPAAWEAQLSRMPIWVFPCC